MTNYISYGELIVLRSHERFIEQHPKMNIGRSVVYKRPIVDAEKEVFVLIGYHQDYKGNLEYIGKAMTGIDAGTDRRISPKRMKFVNGLN